MPHRRQPLTEALLREEEELRAIRMPLETSWQDIARHNIPREATFTDTATPGVTRNRHILDSTAPRSLELFAAFLHTLMNNPAQQWARYRIRARDDLNRDPAVKKWLDDVSKKVLARLEAANVYTHLHKAYLNLGAFGTTISFVGDGGDGALRMQSHHLSNAVIAENEAGDVDTIHLTKQFTPRQAQQRFNPGGDDSISLGKSVDSPQRGRKHEKIRFVHSVVPVTDQVVRDLFPKRFLARGSKFASVWMNAHDRIRVGLGTFEEFPYQVARWYTVEDDVYGRSPAMTVMPDIRMSNRMSETILRGAEKIVDPPFLIPDGGIVSPIRLFPGGLSFSDGEVTPIPLIPPGASRIEIGTELLKQRQDAIREGYFVPLFITPDSPVKTATEVLQQSDERNRAVSPMLVRIQEELLGALLMRAFSVQMRAGALPPPPPILDDTGAELEVEYLSPLAASQKQSEGLALLRFIEQMLPWTQVDPGALDLIDVDKAGTVIGEATGIPGEVVRSKTEIKRIRAARAKQAQTQDLLAQLPDAAGAVAKLQTAGAAQLKAEKA